MMKRFLVITSLIFSCLGLQAQTVTLNNTANIDLPASAKKIDKTKVQDALKKAGKKTVITFGRPNSYFFSINGILFQLNTDTLRHQHQLLKSRKDVFDQFDKAKAGQYNYAASSKKIGSTDILIFYYDKADFSYYRFYAASKSDNKGVEGLLEFNKANKTYAEDLLNHLISTIKFK